MHELLTQRATHLRPPSISATASGDVTLTRANYTSVATNVAIRIGSKSGFIRQGEFGQTAIGEYIGHADAKKDIRVRDVFEIGSDRWEVKFLGNRGYFTQSFDLARLVLS